MRQFSDFIVCKLTTNELVDKHERNKLKLLPKVIQEIRKQPTQVQLATTQSVQLYRTKTKKYIKIKNNETTIKLKQVISIIIY